MARLAVILLLLGSAYAQLWPYPGPGRATTGGGPGSGLITEVSGQGKGRSACANPIVNLGFSNHVTTGNDILVGTISFNSVAGVTHITPSFATGTATIGAFTEDQTYAFNDGASLFYVLSLWRAHVTAGGTLTLSFASTNFTCTIVSIDEFNSTTGAIVPDGSGVTNTGHSNTESTGNVTTSAAGLVVMVSAEGADANFTYTLSGTRIFAASSGFASFTGEDQFIFTPSSGTYSLTAGTAHNWFWGAIGVPYKPQ